MITFKEAEVFMDELLGTIERKAEICLLISNQVAQQWFGNLVSNLLDFHICKV